MSPTGSFVQELFSWTWLEECLLSFSVWTFTAPVLGDGEEAYFVDPARPWSPDSVEKSLTSSSILGDSPDF
jgi:hypothetical protein